MCRDMRDWLGIQRFHEFTDAVLPAVPQQTQRGQAGGFGEHGEDGDSVFHGLAYAPSRICAKTQFRHGNHDASAGRQGVWRARKQTLNLVGFTEIDGAVAV